MKVLISLGYDVAVSAKRSSSGNKTQQRRRSWSSAGPSSASWKSDIILDFDTISD
jgi:hypothetical protein